MVRIAMLKFTIIFLVGSVCFLSGCSSSKVSTGSETIHIGSKSFTENILIGEMMAKLIEVKLGVPVEHKANLGGTMIPWNALTTNDIDMYTEYTGTGLVDILKRPSSTDPQFTYNTVKEEYAEKFSVAWLKPLGFNNTYAIAVPRAFAEKHRLKTIEDLAAVSPDLIFGAEPEFFNRPDGYDAFAKAYGLSFKNKTEINVGLKYEALDKGNVQVINVFSTDANLIKYDLVVLEDSKRFFPTYEAAPIVRQAVLDRHPELEGVLNQLAGQIDDEKMQQLNYEVDVKHRPEKEVAEQFLKSIGLIQ
ncbi:glycine betaine ABC transporter substrate-binding protein [Paenibacillus thermotolerans]|uniref:ABC transporter substrate-binding protein n=1 Tax=Paenibacillus thermotolerans TaxID=3027807 RepID=UPI0023684132|nr:MULTISPECIES: glycine betaine ABC transporter substrate-binding protein [unclassified Paenibacillus]